MPNLLTLTLELATRPASEMQLAVDGCAYEGIRFFALAEVEDTPDTRVRLYELVREGVIDDPSNDGTFMDPEEFSDRLFEPFYWRWAECQFLAAVGDEWVGLTNLQLPASGAQFGVTVVKRAFRRRGIARVLKLQALQYLHDRGTVSVTTRNDPRNTAVLRLNRGLGFEEVY